MHRVADVFDCQQPSLHVHLHAGDDFRDVPLQPDALAQPQAVHDPWVIEWRALTVALLDALAPLVRAELGVDAAALPLACMLEGGSWAAGRQLAAERRAGGAPPVQIVSDGTVF